jgi:hypothetical protein
LVELSFDVGWQRAPIAIDQGSKHRVEGNAAYLAALNQAQPIKRLYGTYSLQIRTRVDADTGKVRCHGRA